MNAINTKLNPRMVATSVWMLFLCIHRVSEKNCANLSFAPWLSNMNRIQ